MKKILKITEVVGNWGEIDTYETAGEIKAYLEDPSYFSDDASVSFEEFGNKGICFISDLFNEEVLVGEEIILVEEE
jgi:hypothetical protein